jgi:hypothetical protein
MTESSNQFFQLDFDRHHNSIKSIKADISCRPVGQRQRFDGFKSLFQFRTHQKPMKSIEITDIASLAAKAIEFRGQ